MMSKEPGTTLPNAAAAILSAVTAACALLASQALIDNRTEKLVTGLAAIFIPVAYMLANSIHHQAKARVKAAEIAAPQSGVQKPTP